MPPLPYIAEAVKEGMLHPLIGLHVKKSEFVFFFSLIGRATIHVYWSYSDWLSYLNETADGDDGCL